MTEVYRYDSRTLCKGKRGQINSTSVFRFLDHLRSVLTNFQLLWAIMVARDDFKGIYYLQDFSMNTGSNNNDKLEGYLHENKVEDEFSQIKFSIILNKPCMM